MNHPKSSQLIIGIDGGATKSTGILVDATGTTIDRITLKGCSLTANLQNAPSRIMSALDELCSRHNLKFRDIQAIGLGLAGASNDDGRDKVFGNLDRVQLSNRTIIMTDAEAAYEIACPGGEGILLSVGTGVICLARDRDGEVHRTGGLGHDSDIGSGYWIGREAMLKIALSDNTIYAEPELMSISRLITQKFKGSDFSDAVEKVMASPNSISNIASLCDPICHMAELHNEIALGLIQEATMGVADLITELAREMEIDMKSVPVLIAGNGSVIKNKIYRNCLQSALKFDAPQLKWVFSRLSPAYGAALLASRFRDIPLSLNSILERFRADCSNS